MATALFNRRRLLVASVNMMAVAAMSNAAAQCTAPDRMLLSSNLKSANLQTATMFPVNVQETVTESDGIMSGDMIKRHLGEHGAVCFVVRRPG